VRVGLGLLLVAGPAMARAGGVAFTADVCRFDGAVTAVDNSLVWTGTGRAVCWFESRAAFTGEWIAVGRARGERPAELTFRLDEGSAVHWRFPAGEPVPVATTWRCAPGLHRAVLEAEGLPDGTGLELRSLLLVGREGTPPVTVLRGGEEGALEERLQRELWERRLRRLRCARSAQLEVTVTCGGSPAVGVPVRIAQTAPDFELGLWLEAADRAAVEMTRCLAVTGVFTAVAAPVVNWKECEPSAKKYEFAETDELLSRLAEWGLAVYTGPLVSQCDEKWPEWSRSLGDDDLRQALLRWARVAAAHLRDRVRTLILLGDLSDCDTVDRRLGLGLARQMAYEVGMVAPGVERAIAAGTLASREETAAVAGKVAAYREADVDIGTLWLGLSGRNPGDVCRLAEIAAAADISLAVCPLYLPAVDNETGIIRGVNSVLDLLAEPRVRKVFVAASALLRREESQEGWVPSEFALCLERVIRHEVLRDVVRLTDENGRVSLRTLCGSYRLVAGTGRGRVVRRVRLGTDGLAVQLSLPVRESASGAAGATEVLSRQEAPEAPGEKEVLTSGAVATNNGTRQGR